MTKHKKTQKTREPRGFPFPRLQGTDKVALQSHTWNINNKKDAQKKDHLGTVSTIGQLLSVLRQWFFCCKLFFVVIVCREGGVVVHCFCCSHCVFEFCILSWFCYIFFSFFFFLLQLCNHLGEEEGAGCFDSLYRCSSMSVCVLMSFPHGLVCNCGISWRTHLLFLLLYISNVAYIEDLTWVLIFYWIY